MRILATSDWHLDAVTFGIPRRDEVLRYIEAVKRAIVAEGVDIVIVSGDMCDPGSMLGSQCAADVIEAFVGLALLTKERMLLAVAGNHDVVEINYALTTLTPAHRAFDTAKRETVSGTPLSIHIAETPMVVAHRGCVFLMLPYLSRAYVDHGIGADELLAGVIQLAAERRPGEKLVVVGHLTIPGAIIGSESLELSRGRDYDLPIGRLSELTPDVVINGHYHRPQVVDVGPFEVVIPGSPLAFTTDDEADGKGYVILEV